MASEETNDDAEIALGREFQAKRWKLKAYHFLIKICIILPVIQISH